MSWYVDTSAFLKLFVDETDALAMRAWWRAHQPRVFSSELLHTETLRAARRISPGAESAARVALDTIDLLVLDAEAFEQAGIMDPPTLRTLDALHLAAAIAAGADLEGVVTYDNRLDAACQARGIDVAAPRD